MRVYKIFDPDNADWPVKFRKTQSDAGQCIKNVSDPDQRPAIQVDLCDVKGDLDNMLLALNGQFADITMTVLKSWRGTKRGGMRDLSETEDGPPPEESEPPAPPPTENADAFWGRLTAKK